VTATNMPTAKSAETITNWPVPPFDPEIEAHQRATASAPGGQAELSKHSWRKPSPCAQTEPKARPPEAVLDHGTEIIQAAARDHGLQSQPIPSTPQRRSCRALIREGRLRMQEDGKWYDATKL